MATPLPLLSIGGPTAVGKSAAAIALAELLERDGVGVTLVSADSRQVFRGFDIGTDKLSQEVRERWPHAGIDVADADTPFTLFDWLEIVRPVVSVTDIAPAAVAPTSPVRVVGSKGESGRPRLAIVVGGTGLYHRGLQRGFLRGSARPHDPRVRRELEEELAVAGREALEARLAELQPEVAARLRDASARRLLRALEIAMLGGDATAPHEEPWGAPVAYIGIDDPDATRHRARIAARVTEQFARGLVEEASALAARFAPDTPALSGIGYAEALRYESGELDRDHAIGLAASRTWAYARRQRTWFRAEPIAERIVSDGAQSTKQAASAMLRVARRLLDSELDSAAGREA